MKMSLINLMLKDVRITVLFPLHSLRNSRHEHRHYFTSFHHMMGDRFYEIYLYDLNCDDSYGYREISDGRFIIEANDKTEL